MKLNLSVLIAGAVLILGLVQHQNIWFPLTVLIAGTIDSYARPWVTSDRFGRNPTTSALLKFILTLVGFYALVGQFLLIGLVIYWFAIPKSTLL